MPHWMFGLLVLWVIPYGGGEAAVLLHELWNGMTPHPVFVKLPIVAPNVASARSGPPTIMMTT